MKHNISVLLSLFTFMIFGSVYAGEPINIWKNTSCKDSVKLTPYIVEGQGNIGVIICPGGSYFWLDKSTEGHDVAKWLNHKGISAFVLEYRTAGIPAFITHYRVILAGHKHPQMIQDLQRAIQIVRENPTSYGISTKKVGVMGFSAGGHLALTSGVFYNTNFLESYNISSSVSLRPDFVVPVYPVVTFREDYMHKRSRRGLLGDKSIKLELCDSMSIENHIHRGMPPVFLVNCKDDPIVKCQNSELLDSVLTKNGVPHKYIQYQAGGHGFGMSDSKGSEECKQWKYAFINWLKELFEDE